MQISGRIDRYRRICITVQAAVRAFVVPANIPALCAATYRALALGFAFRTDIAFWVQAVE